MTVPVGVAQANHSGQPMRDYRAWFMVGIAVILSLNFGLLGYLAYREQRQPQVQLTSLQITGPTALCPNEDLIYTESFDISRPGEVTITGTVRHTHMDWDGYPAVHLHVIVVERFQSEVAGKFSLRRYLSLPLTMTDPLTGLPLPWDVGDYEWQVSIYASGSVPEQFMRVPFTIRNNCPATQ